MKKMLLIVSMAMILGAIPLLSASADYFSIRYRSGRRGYGGRFSYGYRYPRYRRHYYRYGHRYGRGYYHRYPSRGYYYYRPYYRYLYRPSYYYYRGGYYCD